MTVAKWIKKIPTPMRWVSSTTRLIPLTGVSITSVGVSILMLLLPVVESIAHIGQESPGSFTAFSAVVRRLQDRRL